MLRFRRKGAIPPGGLFFFRVPETDVHFEHPELGKLLLLLQAHYQANGVVTPDNLEELVIDFICRNSPESFCRGTTTKPRAEIISPLKVRRATRKISRGALHLTTRAEATRRAQVCGTCAQNLKSYCVNCNGLAAVRGMTIGNDRKTVRDPDLGVCVKNQCILTVLVHLSANALTYDEPREYPENCWIPQALAEQKEDQNEKDNP